MATVVDKNSSEVDAQHNSYLAASLSFNFKPHPTPVDVRGFDFESVKREILIESGAGTGFVKECVKDCDNFIRRRPRTIS